MTRHARTVVLALASLALLLGSAGAVLAAETRVICQVTTAPNPKAELGYLLEARLTTADAKPVNDTLVRFYDVVELFGKREMLIATATTDGQGRATIPYLPAQTGQREIVVRSAARDPFAAGEGRTTLAATVAAPTYEVEPAVLSDFTAKVPFVVGGILVAVWLVIGFALIGTARGIAREAVRATRKENPA